MDRIEFLCIVRQAISEVIVDIEKRDNINRIIDEVVLHATELEMAERSLTDDYYVSALLNKRANSYMSVVSWILTDVQMGFKPTGDKNLDNALKPMIDNLLLTTCFNLIVYNSAGNHDILNSLIGKYIDVKKLDKELMDVVDKHYGIKKYIGG